MKLILTHEQADLDAIASLMGARLLDGQAFALLPRQINRNAATFLQRYSADLNLSSIRDLPTERIEAITLVDTQSLVTLRGVTPNTAVRVIDHHPRHTRVNSAWQTEIQPTGACTTLIVEKLRQEKLPLSVNQATLLLLGIYEDTGSLIYTSTTPRDVYAAAYLLEQGADLSLASHYLNPPLSNAQQLLFDRLLKDMTTYDVEGHQIILAKANALDLSDEISSVAHKLREFLNPDGLIVLVSTRQGVRLVARSTTNDVDMGKLAEHFGGGGHKRAASALIRAESKATQDDVPQHWRSIAQQVVAYLPQIVSPALRVRQIMSQKPLLIDAQTSVETAAELMRRYGFEGYPVMEDGKLVGLLTRRNVDRALQHKLPATAGSLMDAGSVCVTPEDPVNRLQALMASSGWGQVPVIDPESGDVIGIVTRTDLLGSLFTGSQLPRQKEVAVLLQEALPAGRQALLQLVAAEATQTGIQAYIVGGFVRDLLLGHPSQDFDIVVEGDAIRFVHHLVERYGGRAVTHSRFGTAKWILSEDKEKIAAAFPAERQVDPAELPDHLDLITARTEFYEKPAALPTVEQSSIKMDLHRRDFTINTLALRLDGSYYGKLFDFWGGFADLKENRIRVLHALSFVDDATRMLRAVRFAVRFGFTIEPRTLSLLKASLPLLSEISGTRLRHEFDLILSEPKAPAMLAMLAELGILGAVDAHLPWDEPTAGRLTTLYESTLLRGGLLENGEKERWLEIAWTVWLQGLTPQELAQVSANLRLNTSLVKLIEGTSLVRQQLSHLSAARPSEVAAVLDAAQPEVLETLSQTIPSGPEREVLEKYRNVYQWVKPETNGDALRALGLAPSPRFKQILSRLREAWLDGEIRTYAEEQALLRQLIATQ